jgi:hypothetical protein
MGIAWRKTPGPDWSTWPPPTAPSYGSSPPRKSPFRIGCPVGVWGLGFWAGSCPSFPGG